MNSQQIYNSFRTLTSKEIKRILRIWTQTLLPPVVTQSLYFVIFGSFIGSRVGLIDGIPYMAFIIPGLVMMAVINASFSNVVSSFFTSKFTKDIQEIQVSPTPNWVIVFGFVTGGVFRGLLVGLIVFLVSFFFVKPQIQNPLIITLFVFLTSMVFSLGGLINGIFAEKFDDVQIFPTFVLIPLTYLGGVFYSINQLPQVWQIVSKLNPILYMVNGFRYGFYGVSDVSVWYSFLILLAFTVSLAVLAQILLNRGVGMRT
ncbi:ABC transporter permease [Candidatus Gracilibacteria bacterium]|nr:ABC transporter permease [Thermales bacterium]NJL96801.1 ABC transporter permease [Candidatus Gracilibacteria bacterium]NJS41114.1 ABC transporter permease [Candidatus Gracilibacteria bacterium]